MEYNSEYILFLLHNVATKFGVSFKELSQNIRIALTESNKSPPIDQVMLALGKEETIKRLLSAADFDKILDKV